MSPMLEGDNICNIFHFDPKLLKSWFAVFLVHSRIKDCKVFDFRKKCSLPRPRLLEERMMLFEMNTQNRNIILYDFYI